MNKSFNSITETFLNNIRKEIDKQLFFKLRKIIRSNRIELRDIDLDIYSVDTARTLISRLKESKYMIEILDNYDCSKMDLIENEESYTLKTTIETPKIKLYKLIGGM